MQYNLRLSEENAPGKSEQKNENERYCETHEREDVAKYNRKLYTRECEYIIYLWMWINTDKSYLPPSPWLVQQTMYHYN